jgi:hypothetical protein
MKGTVDGVDDPRGIVVKNTFLSSRIRLLANEPRSATPTVCSTYVQGKSPEWRS